MTRHSTRASIQLALPGWLVRYRGDTGEYEAVRDLLGGGRVTYADRDGERLVATVRAAMGQTLVVGS